MLDSLLVKLAIVDRNRRLRSCILSILALQLNQGILK